MNFSVLPFLVAFMAGLLGLAPTNVVQVCYGEMGIEHAQPWRHRSLAAAATGVRGFISSASEMFRAWRAHPFALPAAALVVVLAVHLVAPDHASAFGVMATSIVPRSIKHVRQDVADNDRAIAALKTEGRTLLALAPDKRTDDQGNRVAAIETEIDTLTAKGADLAAELSRFEKFAAEERAQSTVIAGVDRAAEKPVTFGEALQAMAFNAFRANGRSDRANQILPNGIATHVVADLQAAVSGASSGNQEQAGLLVKSAWNTSLLEKAQEAGKIAPRCFPMPIGEGEDGVEAPFVDETSRATGSRWGGVQVYRGAEAATMTASQPKLGKFELRLEDLFGLFYATDRVLRDATLLEALAMKAFASEFAFKLDDEIIRGTGAGQCLGIIGNAPTVSVAKETNQGAGTVVYENIIKMHARLLASCMPGASWFINQALLPQLNKMYLAVGSGGVPVYLPANGVSGAPYGTLMGLPVEPIEQCSAPGTVGDIILGNFSNDYALISKPMTSASSIHVLFTSNQTTFRWVWPIIGKPVRSAAVTPYKGSDTLGPFVTLATRA